jgi:hypothetical protein
MQEFTDRYIAGYRFSGFWVGSHKVSYAKILGDGQGTPEGCIRDTMTSRYARLTH